MRGWRECGGLSPLIGCGHTLLSTTLISLLLPPISAFVWTARWAHDEFAWPPHAQPRAPDGEACRRGGHTPLRPPGPTCPSHSGRLWACGIFGQRLFRIRMIFFMFQRNGFFFSFFKDHIKVVKEKLYHMRMGMLLCIATG